VKCQLKCMSELWAMYYVHNSVLAGQSIEKRTARFHRRNWICLLVSLKCDHLLFVFGFYSVPAPYFGCLQNLLFLGFLMITHKNLDPVIKINNTDCCVRSCCKFYCSVISSITISVKRNSIHKTMFFVMRKKVCLQELVDFNPWKFKGILTSPFFEYDCQV